MLVVIGHFDPFFCRDSSRSIQICLVSSDYDRNILVLILCDLTHPSMHSVKAISISNVVDNNDAVGTLAKIVIRTLLSLETLLANEKPTVSQIWSL